MIQVNELLDYTESDVLRDVVSPRLVPRTTLLQLLNEGYKAFARSTHCFVKTTPFAVPAGVSERSTPSDCIYIRSLRNARGTKLTDFTRRANTPIMGPAEIPTAFSVDVRAGRIWLYPAPASDVTLTISYAALPDDVVEGDCVDLDHDHAYLLAEFIAWKALRNNDPDGSNTIDAKDFAARWVSGVNDAKAFFYHLTMGPSASAQPRRFT